MKYEINRYNGFSEFHKMKTIKIIFTALLLGLFFWQLNAQEQDKLPYKSRAEFQNDTLQYLEYNFSTLRYKGEKVSDVTKDIEYPYSIVGDSKAIDNGIGKLLSLSLGIRQVGNEPNELKDYYVIIGFANPPSLADFIKVSNQPTGISKWTPQLYEFLKDLEVSGVGSNPYIIQRREQENANKKIK